MNIKKHFKGFKTPAWMIIAYGMVSCFAIYKDGSPYYGIVCVFVALASTSAAIVCVNLENGWSKHYKWLDEQFTKGE